MSAALQQTDSIAVPMQLEMLGARPFHKAPKICRALINGGPKESAPVEGAEQLSAAVAAKQISEAQQAMMDRIARTPIVPLAWIRGMTQVTPEDVGERKSGRPRIEITRKLSVNDLDNSITFLQRRTREITKLIKDTSSSSDHTAVIIKGVIKDAIRKLSVNLPEATRDEIDEVVSKF